MPVPFPVRYVELEEREHLLVIKLNRPGQLNSITPGMHCELSKVFRYYDTNEDLWVAVLTGNGRAFCAGNDLKVISGAGAKEDKHMDLTFPGVDLASMPKDLVNVPGGYGFGGLAEREGIKPILAAVNGIAHGGGFEIALSCDIILASEKADFCLPEPRTAGGAPNAGGILRLPRLLGYHNAMRLILTTQRVMGKEAVGMGIAQVLVPGGNEEVLKAALDMADQILLCSPDAIQACTQIVKRSMAEDTNVIASLRKQPDYPASKRSIVGANGKEGPRAFAQKRKPNWVPPAPIESFNEKYEALLGRKTLAKL